MFKTVSVLLSLISIIAIVRNAVGLEKPSNLPCKLNDVECITKMTQWMYDLVIPGDPARGIESSDPMIQKQVDATLGYVNYTVKNAYVTGYKRCKVVKTIITNQASALYLNLACPYFRFRGEYVIGGQLLNFPIRGRGDYTAKTTNYNISLDTTVAYYKQDNNLHVKYQTFAIEADLLGELELDLKNLFGGNKELSDQFHNFANKNPRLVGSLLQGPYFTSNIKRIMKGFNKMLKEIPITDLVQVYEKDIKMGKS